MDKFVIRSTRLPQSQEVRGTSSNASPNIEVDFDNLPMDPGERRKISEYHPDIQDEVRKRYIQVGPIQPKKHEFPFKIIGGRSRRFNATWFETHQNWLEYSKKKDALFCLPCYLFKPEGLRGGDAFVVEGFSCWNKKDRLIEHVGGVKSAHNLAVERYENLKDEKNSIRTVCSEFSKQDKKDYKLRLEASVICAKYLVRMGLPFRGHNESEESNNRGNYIELLKVAGFLSPDIKKVMMKKRSGNLQLTSPGIQKDIVNAISLETLKVIFEELGDDFFAILVDESSDVSYKEQMAIILRFVNKEGILVEHFVGITHVTNTSAISLKSAIDELFDEYKLSLSRVRGQGYDGASNMRGQFDGLKALIQKDNSSAHYIHCFTHQLQLTLVATAKGHVDVVWFFDLVSDVVNVIGSSCKRRDVFRELRAIRIAQAISNGEIETGKGLNQELGIKRSGDTRWGSHYRSLLNLQESFLDVIYVLEFIYNDVFNSTHKKNALG
ncbi:uncharacterized protein LOC141627511 [Silene latifolia]|uniref:uncharacterized protein LOC141627511 n=1 Tax=Silene latifolia TaxID=37657 RepID=UPI003D772F12